MCCVEPITQGALRDAGIVGSCFDILFENLFEEAEDEFFVGG